MKLGDFQKNILKDENIPKDLEAIIKNECAYKILESLGFELIETEEELKNELNTDYLSEEDKKDIDIMAHVNAIDDVLKYITFFAIGERWGTILIGYWRGEENIDILKSPLVRYTSEGEFELFYDSNIIESIVADYVNEDEDKYEIFKDKFKKCGIDLKEVWDLDTYTCNMEPNDLKKKFYNEYRKKLGLSSIK